MNPILRAGAAGAALLSPVFAFACATCGCSLSTDAAMGYSAIPGWRINLDYTYIPQDQLRHGTHSVTLAEAVSINAAGSNQEVERQAINRYTNLSIYYSPNSSWSSGAIVSYVNRSHTTYGSATSDQLTSDNVSGTTASGLGDIKLIANYQGFLPTHDLGVQLGVELPAGRYGGQDMNADAMMGRNPVFFNSDSNTAGRQALDASLRPSAGSADLTLGTYYYQPVSQNFDAFINGQFQAAVTHRLRNASTGFRPDNTATMSLGLRYEANPHIVPRLRFNVTRKGADKGALADATNTAGMVVYLSPGVTVSVAHNLQVCAFLQKALYSNLQGYQLSLRWSGTVGASYAF